MPRKSLTEAFNEWANKPLSYSSRIPDKGEEKGVIEMVTKREAYIETLKGTGWLLLLFVQLPFWILVMETFR